MKSWWDLGEGYGFDGNELALHRIECPFCEEEGNFTLVHHEEKKKPNGQKVLNFDTYKCGSCAGFIMVLWSASSYSGGLHAYRVLPWPQRTTQAPEHWPSDVQRFWLQAQRSLEDENWDAAAVMARSALQVALRHSKAVGDNLKEEINDLALKGILPPLMKEWSHEIRELGNDSAHPKPNQDPTTDNDAKDIVEFMDFTMTYLYNLPKQILEYRKRRKRK
ncbi:DUF4145 domain-containing protein [Patescibacteria group bacterium]|nr:DUF4145 domain-containing protein [Patescibacteria group bacterium]